MKLLIVTQIVDEQDSNLGFFCGWIAEFAKHCEQVTVICLQEGEHTLPANVKVLSLGKPSSAKASKGAGKKFLYAFRFLKYIYAYKDEYDAVFVHMNPEYVLLGSFLWRRWHKTVSLWYAHKSVTWKLRQAVARADYIFSVSDTSFKVPTPKLVVVGHGIDTEQFKPSMHTESTRVRIATVGRIAESKHLIEMLSMLDVLYARKESFTFTIVGAPLTEAEETYATELQAAIAKRPYNADVRMAGVIAHHNLPAFLCGQDIVLNFATTGNMDKAGLEALACGIPLLATNPAFAPLLSPYGLYAKSGRSEDTADALQNFMHRPDKAAVVATLRNKVVEGHSLAKLIPRMLACM
jgi:glycosyltransferase involved in cell wall biosynthesis